MSKVKRNSMVEMLAKVPVTGTRGSLLAAIDKLLKTIEVSESAIMIPTLLRDKCEFDAWELLIIAKIIKASILGHSDLVEFYMSNINHSSSSSNDLEQQQQDSNCNAAQQQNSSLSPTSLSSNSNHNQTSWSASTSPTMKHQNSSTNTIVNIDTQRSNSDQQLLSSMGLLSFSSDSSSLSGLNMKLDSNLSSLNDGSDAAIVSAPTNSNICGQLQNRTVQPPSLLQITTNNNHMNQQRSPNQTTIADNNISSSPNHDIGTMNDQICCLSSSYATSANHYSGFSTGDSTPASSMSGTNLSQTSNSGANSTCNSNILSHNGSISVSLNRGCSSGAMSPYAPHTPVMGYPQAETISKGRHVLPGDPSASAKLLSQIEQLKVSIANVTNLLESVVDLYKNYVDNIA